VGGPLAWPLRAKLGCVGVPCTFGLKLTDGPFRSSSEDDLVGIPHHGVLPAAGHPRLLCAERALTRPSDYPQDYVTSPRSTATSSPRRAFPERFEPCPPESPPESRERVPQDMFDPIPAALFCRTLSRQVDAALQLRNPCPPLEETHERRGFRGQAARFGCQTGAEPRPSRPTILKSYTRWRRQPTGALSSSAKIGQ